MPETTFPTGFQPGFTVRNLPLTTVYPGKVFWVDSNGPAGYGTFARPCASVADALTKCKASRGDIIFCKAGHIETVDSATACVLSVIGVAVVCLGTGAKRATFNLTATGAYVNVTGAGCSLINPRFLTGIDAVAKGLQVAAADFFLGGVEYYDAAAKASTIQVLTTSAALRLYIDGYRFFASTTGTQKTDGIKTVGDLAGAVIKNVKIEGDFSTSPVNVSAAIANLQLENLYLNNTNAGNLAALTLHANTTGFAKNVKCRTAAGTTYVSNVAKMQWAADCEGFSTDGYGGDPIGTPLSGGLEGQVSLAVSRIASVGIQDSTITSKVDSAGLTGSTGNSKMDSVGATASTNVSKIDSTGLGVSTGLSKADSVGATASTNVSKIDSTGLGVSSNQSRVDSVGINTSTIISTLASIATRISQIASKDGL